MKITINGVNVERIAPDTFKADIDGEYTVEPYTFEGTLYEVYEQICDSQGLEV